jgi:methylmalonyl-CoA mutase
VPQIFLNLQKQNRQDIVVILGGIIPAQDYQLLYDQGVKAIFGPGTKITDAAIRILEMIQNDQK